jgi:hypothetical protein
MATSSSTTPSEEVQMTPEQRKVLAWRVEQFEKLGVQTMYAELLADSDADLHKAARMLANGASIDLLVRILL